MAICAGDFKKSQHPWQIVSGACNQPGNEGALEAPKRISLRKFFKRIASGAPLANPDQTRAHSEMDETGVVTDIPENEEARHLPSILDRSLFDHVSESERCLTPAHIQQPLRSGVIKGHQTIDLPAISLEAGSCNPIPPMDDPGF